MYRYNTIQYKNDYSNDNKNNYSKVCFIMLNVNDSTLLKTRPEAKDNI